MTNEQRQAIRARADAATPGPWGWYNDKAGIYAHGDDVFAVGLGGYEDIFSDEDADFIANAREDVPALLAENEELNNRIQELNTHIAKQDVEILDLFDLLDDETLEQMGQDL